MRPPRCQCTRSQVFSDDPGVCHKCGRPAGVVVYPSTWRLALAIAEVAVGLRRVNHRVPKTDN